MLREANWQNLCLFCTGPNVSALLSCPGAQDRVVAGFVVSSPRRRRGTGSWRGHFAAAGARAILFRRWASRKPSTGDFQLESLQTLLWKSLCAAGKVLEIANTCIPASCASLPIRSPKVLDGFPSYWKVANQPRAFK